MGSPLQNELNARCHDAEVKSLLEEIEAQRATANQLERLVQAKNLEIKSILLGHANECEELTNQIEELKTEVADLQKFRSRAETFLSSKNLLQDFYRVSASLTE